MMLASNDVERRPSSTDDAVCLNVCFFSNRQDVVLIANFIRNVQKYAQCFAVGLLEEKCPRAFVLVCAK